MDNYTATEEAYKNGYEKGKQDAMQKLSGCDYCQEDADGYRKKIGAFSITNPFHGSTWQIETAHCKPRQIFFCPMCGRKFPKKG